MVSSRKLMSFHVRISSSLVPALWTSLDSCLLSHSPLSTVHRSRHGTQTLFFIYLITAHGAFVVYCQFMGPLLFTVNLIESLGQWQENYLQILSSLFLKVLKKKKESDVAQSYLTLCNPMDCSLPGSSIHGIFQAGVLEWVAISFWVSGYSSTMNFIHFSEKSIFLPGCPTLFLARKTALTFFLCSIFKFIPFDLILANNFYSFFFNER